MTNTSQSFKDKWEKNADLAFAETLREGSDFFKWITGRNGWNGAEGTRGYLEKKQRILDGGCGNGRVTALLRRYAPESAEVVGIDLVAAHVAERNLAGAPNTRFFQKDLLGDLSDLGTFDFIYCQEVLHHTSDPRGAFLNLCGRLRPNGEIAIYVYKVKAPIREYTDDFVRQKIAGMPYEEAMAACREITELGRVLSETAGKVTVPAVKVLGIEAGEYDVQRFLYHFFMKCYWNPDIDFEANAVINYDWYHPQLCTRHTPDEIRGWVRDAGIAINHACVDHYGITMRGRKAATA
jgi:SAM-dependent methyltransferase